MSSKTESTNALANRIAYKEQMLKVYDDRLYHESKYRMSVKQEKDKCRRKFKIYRVLVIILGLVDLVALYIANGDFLKLNATSDSGALIAMGIGSIALVVGTVVLAFSGIGTALCAYKLVHYARRRNSELDTRDFIWRRFNEMLDISNGITEKTIAERTKMAAELEVDRAEQIRVAEQLRLDYESGKGDQETISMSELFFVKETRHEELPDKRNPLVKIWEE